MQSDSSSAVLAIGELARQTGASVRSLRHYDEQGLLDARRAANGYRVFPPAAVTRVRQIQRLIAAGFTLAEIGQRLPTLWQQEDAGALLAMALQQKLADIDARIRAFRQLVAFDMELDGDAPAGDAA